jgi:hypothetical protein
VLAVHGQRDVDAAGPAAGLVERVVALGDRHVIDGDLVVNGVRAGLESLEAVVGCRA